MLLLNVSKWSLILVVKDVLSSSLNKLDINYGVIPNGLQVNHKSVDDKTNNHLDNLELATDLENKQHGVANGVLYGAASPNHPYYR